jgi:hypothetical protein
MGPDRSKTHSALRLGLGVEAIMRHVLKTERLATLALLSTTCRGSPPSAR